MSIKTKSSSRPKRRTKTQKFSTPSTNKGRLRRNKLKSATARLLRTTAFNELTLDQITTEAGIPTSVFYHYFPNKKELTLELLDEVYEQFHSGIIKAGPFDTFGQGVVAVNTGMLKLYKEYAGLMRCVTEPMFATRWKEHLYDWRNMTADGLAQFADPEYQDKAELSAIAHSMCTMTESVAYEIYVTRNPALRKRLPDVETAAEFLSTLWSRALFMRQPRFVDGSKFKALSHLTGERVSSK